MTVHKGLIPRIRKAEAQLKVLQKLLERETGVTEDEALLLNQLTSMDWTDHVELNNLRKGWGFVRSGKVVNGLKRKEYIEYIGMPSIKFRINDSGRRALARFKEQLKE